MSADRVTTSDLTVAVLGASGYGGVGLLERLHRHPHVGRIVPASRSYEGRRVDAAWPHLAGIPGLGDLIFASPTSALERAGSEVDVVFTATPHGATAPLVARAVESGARAVDLSADYRLDGSTYATWYREHERPELLDDAVYGLVEVTRDALPGARIVAAPGCNATAVNLALAPLADAGWVGDTVVATVVTGASGAGRTPAPGLHFGELNETARPYKPSGTHRHTAEIEWLLRRTLATPPVVSFSPVLAPLTRGIVAMVHTRPASLPATTELAEAVGAFYADAPLVHVLEAPPETKAVAGSDRALVHVHADPRSGSLLAMCAIDNLGKGAAGQAVQGFNLAFGFEETAGLRLGGVWP